MSSSSGKKRPCPAADDDSHDDDDHYVEEALTADLPQYDYTVLEESEIRRRQDADIASVSATYSLSRSSAALLLRHFRWIRSKLDDAFLPDEPSVRRAVGLPHQNNHSRPDPTTTALCGICFESFRRGDTRSAFCGHAFCVECWGGYIESAIGDGDRCLSLRCPSPDCGAAVGEDMIKALAPTKDLRTAYERFLVRSYIEESSYIKWCPAPECVYAVNFTRGSGGFDVTCKCSNKFCWGCSEEAHQPVDCETVKNWIMKNSAESENVNYILAYTKPCPSCKKPIEKNMGCDHMTCRCGHHFCWLCLGNYLNHGACNRFVSSNSQKRAQMSLERYTHYYERWQNNHKSMEKAIYDLSKSENAVERLENSQLCYDTAFLKEAWKQIIECRRVLKWSYAYGYYHIPVEEERKKAFFEYLQGEAQEGLEKLHSCVELELEPFLQAERPLDTFTAFRTKLVGLTNVTKAYFEKLVKALQNGLSDIEFHKEAGSGSDLDLEEDWNCVSCTFFNPPSNGRCGMCGEADSMHWACSRCTFANARTAIFCEACETRRSDL